MKDRCDEEERGRKTSLANRDHGPYGVDISRKGRMSQGNESRLQGVRVPVT